MNSMSPIGRHLTAAPATGSESDPRDPGELAGGWEDELADGTLHGLVLCETLYAELSLGSNYEPFQPGYLWIPYRGEKPSSLTAD